MIGFRSSRRGRTPRRALLVTAFLLAAFAERAAAQPAASPPEGVPLTAGLLADLQVRHLGPAVMSGRIAALDALGRDPDLLYVGSAGGGLWKSDNGGVTFRPVFDDHTQSIGAVAIDQARPDTVWVGTGEPWVRNSVSAGDGVYRTTDGGRTWRHLGLAETEHVADVVVHPDRPDVAYACALGPLWRDGTARGVYRTTDGGATWEQLLYVDEKTGCADLAMDPQSPDVLYAAMWQFRRTPWSFRSGGPGSGLFKSTDGGATWTPLAAGLPEGDLGRIAVAVAPARPSRLYALVEAGETALYRSDDHGATWERVNASQALGERPFYFALLVPDPADPDVVYKPGKSLLVSRDGGATFQAASNGHVHPDHHALWIDPADPEHLYTGTDGGVYVSNDGGTAWRMLQNLPVAQFYHVAYDLDQPYNVCGGLQDNGSWCGPSRSPGGVENRDWVNVGGGDGFYVLPDLSDPNVLYWTWQGGHLMRRDQTTGEVKDVRPQPRADGPALRFNWNAPVYRSRHDPAVLYVGSQFLHRSGDRGESWATRSPDLTTDDPAKQGQHASGGLTLDHSYAENHTTIYTISDAPQDGDVIWVGTDDGNLQVTRDGGATWTNVAPNVPGLPPNTWVSSVEASRHDPAVAYATFDGHQTGDFTPYVYRTADYGRTWTALAGASLEGSVLEGSVLEGSVLEGSVLEGSVLEGSAHVVREDPVDPDLLFVGTERGLFVSVDAGRHWARIEGNMPPVAVRDLAIHPREDDLIAATHGRGIVVLDDITVLRQLTPEVLAADVHLFENRPVAVRLPQGQASHGGNAAFVGANPSEVATIDYYLKKRPLFGEMKVEVYDEHGTLVETLPGSRRKGLNRILWSIRRKPPRMPPAQTLVPYASVGPVLPEGRYTVRLVQGEKTYEGAVVLRADPALPHAEADRRLQQTSVLQAYHLLEDLASLAETLQALRRQLAERREALAATAGDDAVLRADVAALEEHVAALHDTLVMPARGGVTMEQRLREEVAALYGALASYGGRPTETQLRTLARLREALGRQRDRFGRLVAEDVAALNAALARRALDPLTVHVPEAPPGDAAR